MSTFIVAVPAAFSINIIKSAFVAAEEAVLAVDCRVKFAPAVTKASSAYLTRIIPEPPLPESALVSAPPPEAPPVFAVAAEELPFVGVPQAVPPPELAEPASAFPFTT
jgi:hypothetical protein